MSDAVPPEVESLLSRKVMAHLATCRDGRPHAAPVWFRYDAATECVELITTGRKLANVRENPRVAFSIQQDTDGDTEWTVTILGTAEVVDDDGATAAARRKINAKYGADEDAYGDNRLVRVAVGTVAYETY